MKISFFKKTAILGNIFRFIILLPIIYIILFPLFTMISVSLQSIFQARDPSVMWIPKVVTRDNYVYALEALDFGKSLIQTLKVNVVSAFIEVASCAVTAYGFARFKFKGKNILLGLLILIIIIPPEMIAVPTYLQLRYYDLLGILGFVGRLVGTELRPNLINTGFSFWIPSIFSVGIRSGLFIFIYMQFYKGLPKELEEAAYIDGAGPLTTYLRVILPSSSTAILTVTIFSVIWHWNEYYLSSLYFSDTFSLSVRLSSIKDTLNTMNIALANREGIQMAASLLFIIPMLIMYLILQKKFVKSIDSVGIVG